MAVSDVLILCLLCILVAVLGYGFVGKLRKTLYIRKQKKRNRKITQDILHATLAQRALLRMEVMQGDFQGFAAEGTCSTITNEHLILQIADAFGAHRWTNVPLQIFFSVQTKGKTAYYHFVGYSTKSIRKGALTELHIALPESISPGQKRAFLRYTPPKPSILALALWHLSDEKPLPQVGSSLEKPLMFFRPNTNNEMVLDNISAGGLRICIHDRTMERYTSALKLNTHLLFLLVLSNKNSFDEQEDFDINTEQDTDETQNSTEKTTLSFWLSCRVLSVIQDKRKNLWKVAVCFEKWAHLDDSTKKIEWFPTDSNRSIPALSTWIMRSHMEQTKRI